MALPLAAAWGDLTDGIIASSNWFNVENTAGTGPYVGWLNMTIIVAVSCALATAVGSGIQNIAVIAVATAGLGLWAYATGLASRIP